VFIFVFDLAADVVFFSITKARYDFCERLVFQT